MISIVVTAAAAAVDVELDPLRAVLEVAREAIEARPTPPPHGGDPEDELYAAALDVIFELEVALAKTLNNPTGRNPS